MRAIAVVLVVAGCGRLGFDPLADDAGGGSGRDGSTDATGSDDAAVPGPLPALWVTTAEQRPAEQQRVITRSLDGEVGFAAPCGELAVTDEYPFLLGHPALPYAYAIEQRLDGIALGCNSYPVTPVDVGATSRAIQRAVLDVGAGVGFFTADGAVSVGVFRFTIDSSGVPTGNGSANAPTQSGALAFDADTHELYVGGAGELSGYLLDATWQLPPVGAPGAGMCGEPRDLVLSGDQLLVFCADVPQILRYTRNPNGPVAGTSVSYTEVDQVVSLPGNRAVAARRTNPGLDLITFDGGEPNVTPGPSLSARVSAMAISPGGDVIVTAIPVSEETSELTAWQVAGKTLVQGPSIVIDATVFALAITDDPTD